MKMDMYMLTLDQVAGIVDNNGLGEALCSRVHSDQIKDPELRVLWRESQRLIKLIKEIIDAVPVEE
jgi:hypothetical protein